MGLETGRRGRMGTDPRVRRAFPRARCSPRRRRRRMRRMRLRLRRGIRRRLRSPRARSRDGSCCAASSPTVVYRISRARDATTTTRVIASAGCPSRSIGVGTDSWARAKTSSNPPTRSSTSSSGITPGGWRWSPQPRTRRRDDRDTTTPRDRRKKTETRIEPPTSDERRRGTRGNITASRRLRVDPSSRRRYYTPSRLCSSPMKRRARAFDIGTSGVSRAPGSYL